MWVYLNDAFLSIVAHRDNAEVLLVRARRQGDIERAFPTAIVKETPTADYRFRTELPRQVVAETLAKRVSGIDYPNFKSSVAEGERHDAYLGCWAVMSEWQESTEGV
jgi:hypothetical protein